MNIDQNEIKKFDDLSEVWWDESGELKTLHKINPIRMEFISKHAHLSGKKVLDVGCGGGILSESLAKAGATVTAIDMSESALDVARKHNLERLSIDYQNVTIESIADTNPNTFDIVTCLEMLEHVPNPQDIIHACAKACKPNGHIFFSTINRTLKAYLSVILGAEYILRLLPKKTHDYDKFIRPSELDQWARGSQLELKNITGIDYHPLTHRCKFKEDVSVNYLVHYVKG
ncbi:MAG: bifunctional 2-polyprenyl-6-hydroxyphenol methylase/3-demethylubiquinol 3-O-methyltransferase UbiG [Proteobacteria bacterium]|nr:bifunctional 2-polyprenyl-6-hydroxyphenol methylase/3-demethylubiquinol 3-O-methyltransferase UbiG [Pseudomonadota bacterium]